VVQISLVLVSTVTVGAGGAASIEFTGIPQSGTDLLLVFSLRSDNSDDNVKVTLNGSTTGFTNRYLLGTGSSAVSGTVNGRFVGETSISGQTASTFGNSQVYFPNYTSSANKTWSADGVNENNATAATQLLVAGLWSNTAAITSIGLSVTGNFVQHSTASLYTITKA
jgi:hypothetical protein